MDFIFDETNIAEYMAASKYIDFINAAVSDTASSLLAGLPTEQLKAEAAFRFVRDEIRHSWDLNTQRVTKTATEALLYREGSCYSKSMLLAALLRHEGFAVGFCYQRITIGDIQESGYFLHGLNAVFFHSLKRWVRLDASANPRGSHAEFSIDEERLIFHPRPELDEIDFPTIFARPLRSTIDALEMSVTCDDLIRHHLPTNL